MTRREIMLAALAALSVIRAGGARAQSVPQIALPVTQHPLQTAWIAWKAAYMADDGRVVDALQNGASHSESQGYGLLLAATMRDAEAFDMIDSWTTSHLAIRSDSLFAWRWLPDQSVAIPDQNNASDGDLFYAWALVRAATTLNRPALLDRARQIASDLIDACVRPHPDESGRLVFTPAAAGFQHETGLVINPSYLMPMAMQEIAQATGLDTLRVCASDGMTIQTDLAALGLLPDWIELRKDGAVPFDNLSDKNGYDALRAPLFLIWSGNLGHAAVEGQALAYRNAQIASGGSPTVMERQTGRVLELSPDAGYRAIAHLVSCATTNAAGSFMPYFTTEQPYYPATLHLMTLLAQQETMPRCVPL